MQKVQLNVDIDVEKIKARVLKQYKDDEFFQRIYQHLKEKNTYLDVSDVIEVIENQRLCQNCNCLAECQQKIKGHYLTMIDNNISYHPCLYLKNIQKLDEDYKYIVYSTFSLNKTLPSLKDIETTKQRTPILNQFKKITENKSNTGVFLSGPPGVGKTFIVETLLNERLTSQINCAYVLLNDLANELRTLFYSYDSEDKVQFNRIIKRLKNVPFLIIDDIGSEKVDAFLRDDILFPILDHRMKNQLLTCFTSNYTMEYLEQHYAQTSVKLKETVKASRIMERIRVLSQEYLLDESKSRR